MRNRLFNLLLIIVAYAITCAAVATGSYFREGLTVTVGEPSDRKIKATSLVENKLATERNRAEAETRAQNTNPILMIDSAVSDRVDDNLSALFTKLDTIRQSYRDEQEMREQARQDGELAADIRAEEAEAQRIQAEQDGNGPESQDSVSGSVAENADGAVSGDTTDGATENAPHESLAMFSTLTVIFTESQQLHLVGASEAEYRLLSEAVYEVAHAILEQGVQDLDSKTLLAVQEEFKDYNLNGEAASIGYEIVSANLQTNVSVNEEATRLERESIASNYESVWLLKDETIVDEGVIITEEHYAIMESLGMLNTGLEDNLIPMAGAFALIAAVYAACILYLAFYRKTAGTLKKEAVLLFMLYIVILAITWTFASESYVFLPLLVFAMLVAVLLSARVSVVLSMGMTVVCYFIVSGTVDYLLFYVLSGTLVSLLAKYTTQRNKVFMVGLLTACINFVLSCAISLVIDKNNALNLWPAILTTSGIAALNGALTVIICMGSLPIWEALFGVATPVKLLDLTNPTNLLLRRLTIEAPGTYHHSLIVANLAETAALDIGANPGKARVGGYYHDIGKLKYPQYFAENLNGENPHDHMDPLSSVQLIISHVTYGLTLATEYRLPQFVRDVIQEHHGTSLIYFFYRKAKSESAEKDIDEKDFRYPYVIPHSRESACVMLADTVEAAVRSMITRVKSVDEVESQITSLIRDKLYDGQLAESGLSIKDVDTITQSFFRVLKGMYHERIPYPKKEATE